LPRILFPAALESCAPAMSFLREHLDDEFADRLAFVELAVEELLINVVSYAYAGKKPVDAPENWGMLELGLRRVSMDDTPFLCVWVRDWGTPFDPFLEAPKPDLSLDADDRPIGGLGVHLVKNVSAHHCYSGADGENTIELYFRAGGQ